MTLSDEAVGRLSSLSLPFVEDMYRAYQSDPGSVDPSWRSYFANVENGQPAPTHAAAQPPSGDGLSGPARAATGTGVDRVPETAGGNGAGIPGPPPVPGRPTAPLKVPASLTGTTEEAASHVSEWAGWLQNLQLFANATAEELREVANIAEQQHFEQGDYLCHRGQAGHSLYMILEGQVSIQQDGRLITNLGVGEVVGELAVLDHQPRSADVIAETPLTVLKLNGEAFGHLIEERGDLSRGLLGVLASRLRQSSSLQLSVSQLVRAYRYRGHVRATLDPLGRYKETHEELTLEYHGLSDADLDRPVTAQLGQRRLLLPLRQLVEHLQRTYCRSIGVQYMHIDNLEVQTWLRNFMEDTANYRALSHDEQIHILTKLTDAEVFEQFLHRKFVGAKRFSLEGAESLIPLLDDAIDYGGALGVDEVIIGMAHRGRLNVMANILGKPPSQIFREFQDVDPELYLGRGDVKYHLGHSSDIVTSTGHKVHLSLSFNPSHLEFVGPVVLGRVRAKQDRYGDTERQRLLPIIIHGDAAFAGQGVVQELFNLSELPGYTTGGALHIIINNQIGFTTNPEEARSSRYATDVARMLQIPIFHVNGEEPDAVAQVIKLAMDFRATWRKDVVIDMYCYRRHGHNEGDDPTFTQPLMYQAIKRRKTVRTAYVDNIMKLGAVDRATAETIAERSKARLETDLSRSREANFQFEKHSSGGGLWANYQGGCDTDCPEVDTGFPGDELSALLTQISSLPADFNPHKKIVRFLNERKTMARGERPLNWGAAEALAFATLARGKHRIRLAGQDGGRGTFGHRHAELHDQVSGRRYVPLQHISPDQGVFEVFNCPLTETGVLGFEYGFSLDYPDALTIWEAQFGDFCNVAQVIIDQFISSSEDKWNRLTSLVMLLPHGFEGQGPEHSSARLERFLTLAAEDNMQVVNLTTPAQIFHAFRRQVLRSWRKPLVVMSPKSLLRHPKAVSTLGELANGGFQCVISDAEANPDDVTRILLCSGKLFYELIRRRDLSDRQDVAILRLEQYYPFPAERLARALGVYKPGTPVFWVQEEPENMGAWRFLHAKLGTQVQGNGPHPFVGISRPESPSPATGSAASHKIEQAALIDRAFDES